MSTLLKTWKIYICKIVGSHFSEFSPSFTSWAEFESKSLPRDLSKKQFLIDSYSIVFFLYCN
jgi:hypothetical protein